MPLYFNTAGPCVPGEHYMLSPLKRFAHVVDLIDQRKYFTMHSGRQTGKTTNCRALVKHINKGNQYCASWVNIETAREDPNVNTATRTLLNELTRAIKRDLPAVSPLPDSEELLRDSKTAVRVYLEHISRVSQRPLVLFFDEADGLVGEAMVSFLTQLRAGYLDRSDSPFPLAVALVGLRQIRDYALHVEDRHAVSWLGTTSPFNVTAEAATLEPFTRQDVQELLMQHTTATGQAFQPEAVERIWYLSQGHPWFVNALAAEAVDRDVKDRSQPVTAEHIEIGKERIIVERRTHIDSLVALLREPRVRRILAPMLVGERTNEEVLDDDFQYVLGLGIVVQRQGQFEIANPIYREVIPRALNYIQQMQIWQEPRSYVKADGSLNLPKLFAEWQTFWREDGHLAAEGFRLSRSGSALDVDGFLATHSQWRRTHRA